MRATLLIPTLNEGESIRHVLRTFRAAIDGPGRELFRDDPVDWQIVVVDGASTDGTAEIARAEGATVLTEARRGYGRAYRTGFEHAQGEFVATLDGDATYPAERIPELLRYLLDHGLDFLSGNRLVALHRKAMTTEHRIGNWVLNQFMALAYHRFLAPLPGGQIRDSQSGMWVFRRSVLDRVELTQDGMPLSEELKLEVITRGFRFEEVPIRYAERWGRPKLSSWRDGERNLAFLFTKRLRLERELRSGSRLGTPAAQAGGR